MNSLSEYITKEICLGDWGVDEDAKYRCVLYIPQGKAVEVISARLGADTDTAVHNTTYNTFYLQKNDKSAATAVICSLANGPTSGGIAINQTPVAMSAPTAAYKVVGSSSAATYIYFGSVKTSTGQAVPSLMLILEYRYVPVT